MDLPKSFYEQALDTKLLIERLLELAPATLVTYAELSELLGRNITGGTSNLTSARRYIQREYSIVTDVVRGVGVKRLTSEGILGIQEPTKKRINRAVKRCRQKIALAKDDELTPEQVKEKKGFVLMTDTLQHFLKPATRKIIQAAIDDNQSLPMNAVLESMKRVK